MWGLTELPRPFEIAITVLQGNDTIPIKTLVDETTLKPISFIIHFYID